MIIETRAVEPFFKNGFVVGCEDTREGIVIDPGDEVDLLLDAVRQHHLTIRYILLTHAHLDHVTGVGTARRALNVPVGLHSDDNFLYEGVVQQGMMFGLRVEPQPEVDFFYDKGRESFRFGNHGAGCSTRQGTVPAASALRSVGGKREEPSRDGCAARSLSGTPCSTDRSAGPICRAGASTPSAIDPRGAVQLS